MHGHKHKAAHDVLIANDHRRLCIDFHKPLIQIYIGNWASLERAFDIPLGCLCFVMIHLAHSQVNSYPKTTLNFLGSQIK